MREGITAGDIALLLGSGLRFFRVRVKRPEEVSWTNLSDLAGGDWVLRVRADGETPDQPASRFGFSLVHTEGDSIAPGISASPHNFDAALEFRPLIHPGRDVEISVAVIASGTPVSGDWKPWLRGKIEDVEWPGDEVVASCLTLDTVLVQTQIEEEEEYPEAAVETTIQALLDRWRGAGAVPLRVIGTPGWNVAKNIYPAGGSLGNQILQLAQANGWDVRYKWSQTHGEFRLTLYEPPRDKTVADVTLTNSQVYAVAGLEESRRFVRNAFAVSFKDSTSGLRQVETGEEADSIAEYDRQFMLITEDDDSPIDSSARALALIDYAIHDLAYPPAEARYVIPFLPWLELGDLVEIEADDQHFDFDNSFAVVGLAHEVGGDGGAGTTFDGRGGGPIGMLLGWFRRSVRRTIEEFDIDAVPSLDEDDGDFYLLPNRRVAAEAVYYTVTTDGTEPADPLGASEAGGPVGTLTTAEKVLVATVTVDGTVVWVRVVAVRDAGGTGEVGPIREAIATFHAGDNRPDVSWLPFQPTDLEKEGIRFIARDDGPTVEVGYAVTNAGDPEPSWPGDYTTSGLVADPAIIQAEVTRPAEGAASKVVYYQAVDAAGNLAFEKPQQLRIDGNRIPSGWLDYPSLDFGALPKVIPNSDDADTGSWRFKVNKTTEADDTYDLPAFSDVDPNEFSGNTVGTPIDLDDTHRLGAGEKLNIAAYFFRTTSAIAATQSGSIRSEPTYIQIRVGSGLTAPTAISVLSAQWEIIGASEVFPAGLWAVYQMNLSPGEAVQSMNVAYRDYTDPGSPGVWLDYDYNIDEPELHTLRNNTDPSQPANLDVNANLEIWITPYDAVGGEAGSGNPGPVVKIYTGLAQNQLSGTTVQGTDAVSRTTDVLMVPTRGLSVGVDADTGRAMIGRDFDARVYGAALDLATNDTTAIQAAVDDAGAVGGGDVYIGGGALVSTIKLKLGVRLIGDGFGAVLKQMPNQYVLKDSGTSTGGNTANTLNDTGKAWSTDQHIMKTLAITSGPLAGQLRVIISNTATQLVVGMETGHGSEDWASAPGSVTYEIREGIPLVQSYDDSNDWWHVSKIRLDGNRTNQVSFNPGIYFSGVYGAYGTEDFQIARDVLIKDVSGWAVLVGGKSVQQSVPPGTGPRMGLCENVLVHNCRRGFMGWPHGGTDWRFSNCVVGRSDHEGIVTNITHAFWEHCKVFGAGQANNVNTGSGWLVTQPCFITDCDGQENWEHGFYVLNGKVKMEVHADSNRLDGVHLYNTTDSFIKIWAQGQVSGLLYQQRWAVSVTGMGVPADRSERNRIRVIADSDHSAGAVDPALEGFDNDIIANSRIQGRAYSAYGEDAADSEHFTWGKRGSPTSTKPYFALTTAAGFPKLSKLVGWDGSTAKTFLWFDYNSGGVILGDGSTVTDMRILGTVVVSGATNLESTTTIGKATGTANTYPNPILYMRSNFTTPSTIMMKVSGAGTVELNANAIAENSMVEWALTMGAQNDLLRITRAATPGALRHEVLRLMATSLSLHYTSYDTIRLLQQPAASGGAVLAQTNDLSDYEPLALIGEVVNLNARTGVGTSATVLAASDASILLYRDLLFNGTRDIGDFAGSARPRNIYITGSVLTSGGSFQSKTTNEGLTWGKAGSPASNNPYYALKHDNAGSNPIGQLVSWDGATARTFFNLDHANNIIDILPGGGTIKLHGSQLSFGANDSGDTAGTRMVQVPNS